LANLPVQRRDRHCYLAEKKSIEILGTQADAFKPVMQKVS
jgi:hypothetical protein